VAALRAPRLLLALVAGMALACEAAPSGPSITFTSPFGEAPATGSSYAFAQQPVTVTITNTARSGNATVTYEVDVAQSEAFSPLVASITGVAEAAGGTTTVTLPTLEGGRTYYWRSRAVVDGMSSVPSAPRMFVVRAPVTIQAPGIVAPADQVRVFTGKPTFTVRNATRSGDAAALSYEFQVSSSAGFSSIAASGTVAEGTSDTSWTPNLDLPLGHFYWRARAVDVANQVTGPFSAAPAFERRPATGDFFDLSTATIVLGPTDIANWTVGAQVTSAYANSSEICIDHPGLGTWPNTIFFGDPADLVQGNQWMFAFINGRWYGGSARWFRPGQACKGISNDPFQGTFYMDGSEPLRSYVPRVGDTIGLMSSTPNRFYPDMRTSDQRTNVVLVTFGG
jgi:hypothetical protein